MEDFDELVVALHERNIKLIMDFVPNHSSDIISWFNQSVNRIEPFTDFYVWKDPKFDENGKRTEPNNWVSQFGGSQWEWNEERGQYYLHRFHVSQPDLNFEYPFVTEVMMDVLKFWLDRGVDGFRMDAVPHLYENQEFPDELPDPNRPADALPDEYRYWLHVHTYNRPQVLVKMEEFRRFLDNYTANNGGDTRLVTVEATIPTIPGLMKYYGNDTHPIAHFPCNFEFIRKLKENFTASVIAGMVDEWMREMPAGGTANWNVGNHDTSRTGTRFGQGAIDAFNMIVHLLPGSSIVYYGEEIGMVNRDMSWEETVDPFGCNAGPERYHLFSRDPERTPMQWSNDTNAGFSNANSTWLPVHENYVELNVYFQKNQKESHLENFKKISALRKSKAWTHGSLETQTMNEDNVFGFSRIFNDKGFLVLANFGTAEVSVDAKSAFRVSETATVYVRSMGFLPETTIVGENIDTSSIVIGGGHSLTLEISNLSNLLYQSPAAFAITIILCVYLMF